MGKLEKANAIGVFIKIGNYLGIEIDSRFVPSIKINKSSIDNIAESAVVFRTINTRLIVSYNHNRKPNFGDLGPYLLKTDIIEAKIGYLLPDLYNMRKDWIMALMTIEVDQNLKSLPI
ncbi:MlrC C-terminal domain-containing protein [Maribacter ulvicola]|nr:MlrC C-terminal domain-containing protein [Maribacter ulvicola]